MEEVLLERFGPGVAPARDTGFTDSVMGYVDETLIRLAGGGWGWQTDPGEYADTPLVHPDDALELPPISPLRLMVQAVRARTGKEFSAAYQRLREAVARHQERDPSWSPVNAQADRPRHEWLVNWLATREAGFAGWVTESGREADTWDFSEDSLDALESLVRQRIPTLEAIDEPANTDFVQGAVWYFGEVAVRHKGATWWYVPDDADSGGYEASGNPWVGEPYVMQPGDDGHVGMPVAELEAPPAGRGAWGAAPTFRVLPLTCLRRGST
ncbi:MAG: hypothetical protein ACRDTM_10130 [Micromonosporaceae bacterium]